jgi:hypothetical protein
LIRVKRQIKALNQWALNHTEGMLAGLAQAHHWFDAAITHLERAVDATHRLGFATAEAHHLADLGHAQEQGDDRPCAIASQERSLETAHGTGDLRTAALAAARLGRVLRVTGRPAGRQESAE